MCEHAECDRRESEPGGPSPRLGTAVFTIRGSATGNEEARRIRERGSSLLPKLSCLTADASSHHSGDGWFPQPDYGDEIKKFGARHRDVEMAR